MNVQSNIKYTEAESALLAQLDNSSAEAPVEARKAAMAQIAAKGLPTRRVEAWHYTDLRSALRSIQAGNSGKQSNLVADAEPVSGAKIAGVSVSKLSSAGVQFNALAADDAIGQINTTMTNGGVTVEIGKGTVVESALVLSNDASHARNALNVGEGASATFVQHFNGGEGFSTDVTHLKLDANAEATFILVQEKADDASHLGQLNISLGADAKLAIVLLNAGGKLARQEIIVDVSGETADLDIKGVNLIGGESHIDVTTRLDHKVVNTTSTQVFRNIASGRGKGVFQGQINVAQPAQQTDARMACNTLLLSDDAEFSAKPELEIFADDVQCAHGATVTDIDEDHLFYLRARGISEKDARTLLVKAFVGELFDEIDNEPLVAALDSRISDWLDANG